MHGQGWKFTSEYAGLNKSSEVCWNTQNQIRIAKTPSPNGVNFKAHHPVKIHPLEYVSISDPLARESMYELNKV